MSKSMFRNLPSIWRMGLVVAKEKSNGRERADFSVPWAGEKPEKILALILG